MYKAGSRESSPFVTPTGRGRPGWPRQGSIPWSTLIAVAVGGVLGALARQGLWALFPHGQGGFHWTTFVINVGGCALIGALMTAIREVRHAHRLTGPFLAVGVLGGFTTFSTYIVEAKHSITAGAPAIGLAYLAVTLLAAVTAVYAGVGVTRMLSRWHQKEQS